MPLIAADTLSLQYAGKVIFEDASIAVEPGERLGVVGANGTGKSTLLKILVGQVAPDGGRVSRAQGCRVGYLPQEHGDPDDGALLEVVLRGAPGKHAIEQRLEAVESALCHSTSAEEQLALSAELAELHAVLAEIDRRFARHEAERILSGLGFDPADWERPVRALSGGWRMRAALAALLFQRPDVLLLDEPTNHLDLPSVHWLSRFLSAFRQALVLISHDREFLNHHVRRIASLEIEGLRHYQGNYDAYLLQREQELEFLENRVRRDEQRRRELEAFVERFRAKATKARQAQSKARLIEKMQAEQVEIPKPRKSIALRFAPASRSGDSVLRIDRISHRYGDRIVLRDLDLLVRRGDRIAIVGKNGAGKTTLLKLLAGELEPASGSITLGQNVRASYFAQHHTEVLDPRKTVLDEVWRARSDMSQTEARTICGAFLFSGDEVEKTIGVLSGGEKARVALARLLAEPGNLLLLDEPTNHLDTESAHKLTDSLATYDGTLLFVSHNLDFARRLSNKVWDVHDGRVEDYPGSLGDYLDHLSTLDVNAEHTPSLSPESGASAGTEDRAARREAWARAREEQAKIRKRHALLKRQIAEAESDITILETEQRRLEEELADPETHRDPTRARNLAKSYDAVKARLEARIHEWERLEVELAEARYCENPSSR